MRNSVGPPEPIDTPLLWPSDRLHPDPECGIGGALAPGSTARGVAGGRGSRAARRRSSPMPPAPIALIGCWVAAPGRGIGGLLFG